MRTNCLKWLINTFKHALDAFEYNFSHNIDYLFNLAHTKYTFNKQDHRIINVANINENYQWTHDIVDTFF